MYEIVKHYRNDEKLRRSFNELAERTFGLNFEEWYQNGFWGDNYDPYSVVIDGKVVANVSLNRTDMMVGGQRKRLYQLGTVMTAEEFRGRGYIRAIMAQIEKDTRDADGIYLFANDSVLDFYPKFCFAPGKEYCYTGEVTGNGQRTMERVPMENAADWVVLRQAMDESTFPTACRMVGNPGLIFFYVSQFLRQCVYYSAALDAWAVAELEDGVLLLHEVYASSDVTLDQVVEAFGSEVKRVVLGFAPADPAGFRQEELREEDCTFFVKGEVFREFSARKLRIPSLSHA